MISLNLNGQGSKVKFICKCGVSRNAMNTMKVWKGMSVVEVLVLLGAVPIAVKKAVNE